MSELDRERREIAATLQQPGLGPDPKLRITRRTFVHRSCVAGAATVAQTFGWWPLINTIDMAYAAEPPFKFAWISDTHLYPESVNTRFVEKVKRAAKEVQDMSPPADFLIFGGDLAQLGRANELALGVQLLAEVKVRKVFIPGEHDWYYDMGKEWMRLFDKPNWTFDHKGVRFVGLDTVTRAPDYWSARKMSPEERMDYMADLDGSVAGPWAGVGRDQLDWLSKTLASWDKSRPIVIFSHNPLYEYYPPWNFWVRDWRDVNEVLITLQQRYQHPRSRPPSALQRDWQNAVDRHAGNVLAVALCPGRRAQAHGADDPRRSRRFLRRRRLESAQHEQ